MANWIEIPGPVWVNLDMVTAIRVVRITNPSESYRVVAESDSGNITLADRLRDASSSERVIRNLLRTANLQPPVLDPSMQL